MTPIIPELVVKRPVYQQDELNRISQYSSPVTPLKETIFSSCHNIKARNYVKEIVPMTTWLFRYNWKDNFFNDLVAGVTVAIMHIPQGMAYAMLANVPPIVGIYMAFFPVLIYCIFGTSRHNSMGTFAVACMMTGKLVVAHSNMNHVKNSTFSNQNNETTIPEYAAIEVATIVSFAVSLYQIAMYCLRFGVITSLLSETLVSGFTTGAAVHVLTSQIKHIFGLKLVNRIGLFKIPRTYIDIFTCIDSVNTASMVISAITIILLLLNNELMKTQISKLCALPMPIEMIVIILGTLSSSYLNLTNVYEIETVGQIPVGLPEPKLPPFSLLSNVLVDSFVIAVVTYTISMSMALFFAQKMNYDVNSNQELLAQGLGNLVGSFFSCMPFCASLSRSLIQQTVGGKTQLASLISCCILLPVLLWLGPFFEPLPKCVLASIIVIALKGMFIQVKDLLQFWRLSWTDATIWLVTFLGVVILDIEFGLLIGATLCLINLLLLSIRPYTCRLGLLPSTELYLDVKRFKGTVDIPGIKVFHYCGGLNFATRRHFRKEVYEIAEVIPQDATTQQSKELVKNNIRTQDTKLKVLILDFSALMHIDAAGMVTLRTLINEYNKINVSVYLTGCSGPVYEQINSYDTEEGKERFIIFPTVNDAVNFARYEHRMVQSGMAYDSNVEESHVSRL